MVANSRNIFFPSEPNDYLLSNYPNPFNSSTTISYRIFGFSKVNLTVYDIMGRKVKVLVDEYQDKGIYQVNFDAGELSSGIYFYRLDAFKSFTKKMILMK